MPYLTKRTIEEQAQQLIERYYQQEVGTLIAPIDIDGILELQLGYDLVIEDLKQRFGKDGVLGATASNENTIYIDSSLDTPESLGRYRFTLAHEIGHIVLHIPPPSDTVQLSLLDDVSQQPTPLFRCGEGELKVTSNFSPIEWQANYFASCLLMPKQRVMNAITYFRKEPSVTKNQPLAEQYSVVSMMATHFQVSYEAMTYRIQKLEPPVASLDLK